MTIFPLAPDQTIAQMWSNGVRGEPIEPTKMFTVYRPVHNLLFMPLLSCPPTSSQSQR